jgi:hypothetical protein
VSKPPALLAALLIAAPWAAAGAPAPGAPKADPNAPRLTLSGSIDSYFTLDLTHGQDITSPTGGDTAPTGFNLNRARLSAVADAGPASLRLDLGYGKAGVAAGDFLVEQAYLTMKLSRVTLDAGRFASPAGFEVLEAKDNWLYSKGLLYTFAHPHSHEGLRASAPVTPTLTLSAILANGSDLRGNDVGAGAASGFSGSPYKTVMLGGRYVTEATVASASLFVSKDPISHDDTMLLDAVFTQGMGPTAVSLSGDFGRQGSSNWFGLAASVRHKLAEDGLRIMGRIEYLDDKDGVHAITYPDTSTFLSPGPSTLVVSLTGGVAYPVGRNAELKAELRADRASEKVYGVNDPSDLIATFTAGAIAWF